MTAGIRRILSRIDGRGYKAYKDLRGASEEARGVLLRVVRVQGDPFAPPSVVEARVRAGWIEGLPECRGAEVAVADYFHRRLREWLRRVEEKVGEGHSGELRLPRPGPIMIPRAASQYRGGALRFLVRAGLPSRRRRVLAGEAERLLLEKLPRAVRSVVDREKGEPQGLREWCRTWRDQERLREWLEEEGLVAFVADGSILPRRCGTCEEPLEGAVPFESPPSLRREAHLPYRGPVTGMGVPRGLTVIVGPAFHGKTTLLDALAKGVWNHVPGDGRELVVTRRDGVLVESENGRRVKCVDLRAFLRGLPGGGDPSCFTTDSASGATSAASSVQEAVEAGSRLVLLDEDTVATNFLHRDAWVEEYTGKKTLVTLTELAASMKRHGISLIVVASGALPLLAAADTIIVMDEYRARDATSYREEARRRSIAAGLLREEPYTPPRRRRLEPPRLGKWRLRGLVLEAGGRRVILGSGNAKQLEDPHQLQSAVEAAIEGGDPLGRVHSSTVPETVYVRPLDVHYVLSRL